MWQAKPKIYASSHNNKCKFYSNMSYSSEWNFFFIDEYKEKYEDKYPSIKIQNSIIFEE